MFSLDPSRMYAALRCIESELEKPRPSIKRIREIMAEAGRELRPTTGAVDFASAPVKSCALDLGGYACSCGLHESQSH